MNRQFYQPVFDMQTSKPVSSYSKSKRYLGIKMEQNITKKWE